MFGEKLKKIRKENNLSLEEIAKIFSETFDVGTNKTTISRWENNKQNTDVSSLKLYSDYFEVSMDYLMGYTEKVYRVKEENIEDLRNKLNEKELMELDILINLILTLFQKNVELKEETKEELIKTLTKTFIESLENIKNNEKIGEMEI